MSKQSLWRFNAAFEKRVNIQALEANIDILLRDYFFEILSLAIS